MEEYVRTSLQRFQYSDQFKETAAFRIIFRGEEPSHAMANLDIHNDYTLCNWLRIRPRWWPSTVRPPRRTSPLVATVLLGPMPLFCTVQLPTPVLEPL